MFTKTGIRRLSHGLLGALWVFAVMSPSRADDTDIYLNPGFGLPPGSEPLVMFSLDYRPNLTATACQGTECNTLISEGYLPSSGPYTFFDVLRAALKKVMKPLEGVRVGLMLNHDNSVGSKRSNGGYIAMGFEPFLANDSNNAKKKFHEILAKMPLPQGAQSHSYQGKELYFEFFRYLTGQDVLNGHLGWTDYATDNTKNLDQDGADYDWDPLIESGGKYKSPFQSSSECVRTFAVNMMFFVANQEDDSDTQIKAPVASGGFGTPERQFPDVIRYMHDADLANGVYGTAPNLPRQQSVTSYFLVDPTFINTTSIGYAQAGGTGFPLELTKNPDELVRTLQEVFNQILSVSTTFVAASVPVNVFNRAEIVDNVYLALFQVDKGNQPTWPGNIKKLRLATLDTATYLADALDAPAVAADGRIRRDALTFWTKPTQLPPPNPIENEVAQRDGRSVSRGGSGQIVPGFLTNNIGLLNGVGSRRVFYESGSALKPFNVDTTTATDLQTLLGALDLNEAAALIGYQRGLDVDDLDGDANVTEPRKWLIGDPLHSRPLPINYGARPGYSTTNPAIYLAYGSNDGYLHFLRNTTTAATQDGSEAWAFMPRTSAPKIKTLRKNVIATPHPYTVDGSPVAYLNDTNGNGTIDSGEQAYLYFGLRRGGKSYYALDISDPESPQFLWKIDKGGNFAELGYSFSTPRVGFVNLGAGRVPVLVFAGGYDTNKDQRVGVGTDDAEGNAIFVVNALTGQLIWKARKGSAAPSATVFEHPGLLDSIPSDVSVLDVNGDGLLDRIVVGDTGGNIWRADIFGSNTLNWKLTQLAALGRHSPTFSGNKADDRRFFHRPDVVLSKDATGPYDAVAIGSGDRPDPLDYGGLVTNYFYMVKDRNTLPGSGTNIAIDHAALGDVTSNCIQESGCTIDLNKGWRLRLEDAGEKVLSTAVTIAGTIFATSYIPGGAAAADPCTPSEGRGRLYALGLQDARSVFNYDTSTDPANSDPESGTTKSDRSTNLTAPGIPAEVVALPPDKIIRPDLQVDTLNATMRWRTFWYLTEDTDL